MRLQKQLSKKVGNVTYDKYVIVIKPSVIEKLGWKEGQELEGVVKDDKLTIRKEDKKPNDDFKTKLKKDKEPKKEE